MKNQTPSSIKNTAQPFISLEDLRTDPDAALRKIYRSYQAEFINLVSKYSRLDRDELADVFQDASIVLIQHVRSGKLAELTSTLKTYLFGIGKRMLLKKHSSIRREFFLAEIDDTLVNDLTPSAHHAIELTETEQLLRLALDKLGPICQRILTLTFYDGLRSAVIAERLGYADESVVRVQRMRCVKRLRELVKDKI